MTRLSRRALLSAGAIGAFGAFGAVGAAGIAASGVRAQLAAPRLVQISARRFAFSSSAEAPARRMDRREFEQRVLPHLDAGYNLARWLLRDAAQADDVVQEAALRALRYADALRDGDARPWFLGIVRHTCFDALARARRDGPTLDFDAAGFAHALHQPQHAGLPAESPGPEGQLQRSQQRARVDAAIRALSPPLREVLVLREFEDLDYAGIAQIVGVPVGTVMSRLSRARERLRAVLAPDLEGR